MPSWDTDYNIVIISFSESCLNVTVKTFSDRSVLNLDTHTSAFYTSVAPDSVNSNCRIFCTVTGTVDTGHPEVVSCVFSFYSSLSVFDS